jgi:hypothetical protein
VPYSQKTLDRLTKPLLSLSPEFKPQTVSPAFKPLNREPIYPAWTGSSASPSLFLSPKWAKHKHWATVTPTNQQERIAA